MRILYFDCFAGAAGDMILGALIDAGLPLEELRRGLGSLAVEHDTIWTERVARAGVSATKFHVRGEDARQTSQVTGQSPANDKKSHAHTHEHGHSDVHSHSPHSHRTVREIGQLIDSSALSATGKTRAKALFERLAEVEAAIHGTSIDEVHLHEVGALDSIIDIVGTVCALEVLGIDAVASSPLNVGGGTVRTAHGLYPVPAPATVRLLEGAPIYAGSQQAELVTPTGALLVTDYAQRYGPVPVMRLTKVGYGAGSSDFADTPNVLRVLIGEADAAAGHLGVSGIEAPGAVVVMEAEIDDMNPQIFGVLMDRLLAARALDVFYTPIQMKKSRPGTLLTIIAPPDAREQLTSLVFRETTTIGVRYREMQRECLDRETVTVETPFGNVGVKVARRRGEALNAAPEFEDCARLASETGAPVKDVQAAAMRAYLEQETADRRQEKEGRRKKIGGKK